MIAIPPARAAIRAGARGLAFFTLRPAPDAGALYMPGARAEMIRKARRNVAGGAPLGAAATAANAGTTPLVAPHDDGLAAWLIHAERGATITAPEGAGGGRYYLVADGDVELNGERLPRWSCVWTGRGESPPALAAGAAGADVVILQFPVSERAAS